MILLIDNYDSFTYNLYQYLTELGVEVKVVRNDTITIAEIEKMKPEKIVISPGPGRPEEAGIIIDIIKKFAGSIPILGVCLGHQAIGLAFGAKIVSAPVIMHGKTSEIFHDGKGIFSGIPSPFEATRYHSLIVSNNNLPDQLEVSAKTSDGVIMGLRHKRFPVDGIQFHPESIMTLHGKSILRNFLFPSKIKNEDKTQKTEDFTPLLEKAMSGSVLSREEMHSAIRLMMKGEVSDIKIAGFLASLRARGETIEELAAAAAEMLNHAVKVKCDLFSVDTCGTGGDKTGTFNISTAASFVAAGAGVVVAKHGNRSITSSCGSSDVLTALGVKIDPPPPVMEKALNTINIAFFFAPLYHPAMKYVMNARKELKSRTMFNILGPLCNPALAKGRVLGVFDKKLLEIIPSVLIILGIKRAFVFHSRDGMDEISLNAATDIVQIDEGKLKRFILDPQDLGFKRCSIKDIAGGLSEDNADIILNILKGEQSPRRDITVLNAACSIIVAGLAKTFREAIKLANDSIDSGKAYEKLLELKSISME